MITTTWRDAKQYLSSLWLLDREDDRPASGFHGAFIPAVAEGLILRHTQPDDWIWDPMAGSGTTKMAANYLGRRCFMSDIAPISGDVYSDDARMCRPQATNKDEPALFQMKYQGMYEDFLFDLIILHPPYYNTIRFSQSDACLGNCSSVQDFLAEFSLVCDNVVTHLKPGGYIGLVIGDVWGETQMIPLGFLCMQRALAALGAGARLKAIVIKDIKHHAGHKRGQANLWLSRYFRWGAVKFDTEYIISMQSATHKGKTKGMPLVLENVLDKFGE